MRSLKRSLLAFTLVGVILGILFSVLNSTQLAAETPMTVAADYPHILSGQKPRQQAFFAGENANFAVSITNTGTVNLQSVSVTGATSPDCNRANLGTLTPGQSLTYSCERVGVTQSYLNELQANGTVNKTTVSQRSKAFVNILNSDLRITKTPQIQTVRKGETAFFTVTILNTSGFLMTLDEVDDALNSNCDRNPTITVVIPSGESINYICTQSNVQETMTSIIRVTTVNPLTIDVYTATDASWIDLLTLDASMTPDPASITEPGGLVTYTVTVVNSGSPVVTLTGLNTAKYGNLFDAANPNVEEGRNSCLSGATPVDLQPNGGQFTCSFVAPVSGQPSQFVDTLTVTGLSKNGIEVTATAESAVTITNLPSSITLTLGANPSFINPPSHTVNYSIQVLNTSEADVVTVTELSDSVLGNLNDRGTCAVPTSAISPGSSYQCQFSTIVSGQLGDQISRTITVKAVDDDPIPNTITDSEVSTVSVIQQPEQRIYMPNVTDDNDPIIEPNNSCSNAHLMIVNRQYFVTPPNKYPADQDYFSFDLSDDSNVTLVLNNFVPRAGQIVVRYDDPDKPEPNCLLVWYRNPRLVLNNTMDLGEMTAGRYFIQLINDGPSNVGELYSLIVRVD